MTKWIHQTIDNMTKEKPYHPSLVSQAYYDHYARWPKQKKLLDEAIAQGGLVILKPTPLPSRDLIPALQRAINKEFNKND